MFIQKNGQAAIPAKSFWCLKIELNNIVPIWTDIPTTISVLSIYRHPLLVDHRLIRQKMSHPPGSVLTWRGVRLRDLVSEL